MLLQGCLLPLSIFALFLLSHSYLFACIVCLYKPCSLWKSQLKSLSVPTFPADHVSQRGSQGRGAACPLNLGMKLPQGAAEQPGAALSGSGLLGHPDMYKFPFTHALDTTTLPYCTKLFQWFRERFALVALAGKVFANAPIGPPNN